MRRGDEHDHGGHHGVDAQPDQAEPVYHHRRELPVGHRQLLLVLLPRPLGQVPAVQCSVELQTKVCGDFPITEAPTRTWLKVPTSAFTFKTLC